MTQWLERLQRSFGRDPYYRRLMRDVRRQGWAAAPLCDEAARLFWTYTIGFDETLGHPEIVTTGASDRIVRETLWRVFQAVKRGELEIHDGMSWDLVGHGRYVWREVHATRLTPNADWLLMALHRRWERTGSPQGMRAFQLVPADDRGLFPWEAGYDELLRDHEPQLWLPEGESEVAAARGL